MKNYYDILNVKKEASENEIYKAYRDKISQFNGLPFLTKQMSTEIKELKVAIYILGDEIKRQKYNIKMGKRKPIIQNNSVENTKICDRLFSITF
jgi:DnaJ-class molecular chaperone